MPRVNVWIPDELHATIKRRLPRLNLSRVVQRALAAQLDCAHDDLVCAACSTSVDHGQLVDVALGRFYSDALWELANLARAGGTAEGAARILKEVGQRYRITLASRIPLPRRTRAERAAKTITPIPTEAGSRRRHPTARRTA